MKATQWLAGEVVVGHAVGPKDKREQVTFWPRLVNRGFWIIKCQIIKLLLV